MKSDKALVSTSDFVLALGLLSRLPGPAAGVRRGARAAWAYPLAGAALGALAGLTGGLALWLGLPAPLCALVALACLVIMTGALHEDGLADAADGLWGGWNRAQRLDIMRDSRIGSYGVIALVFGISARWAALWILFDVGFGTAFWGLVAAAALSRASLPALMAALPPARPDGLARAVGRPPRDTALLAAAVGAVIAVLAFGWSGLAAAIAVGLAAVVTGHIARARIGGQTGDILGAAQQVTEIAALFCLLP